METSVGTIRLVSRKKKSSRVKEAIRGIFTWAGKVALVVGLAHRLGLLEAHLIWLIMTLTVREILMWIARISNRHRRWCMSAAKKMGMAVLFGTLFLGFCSPAEASGAATALVNTSMDRLISTIGADCVLQNRSALIRARYRIDIENQMALYRKLCEDRQVSSPRLLSYFPNIHISVGQLNRIRQEWGLSRLRGRPGKTCLREAERTQKISCLPKAGAHLFAGWLEQDEQFQQSLQAIYAHIENYKMQYPEQNFRLLRTRRETIAKKWKALHLIALLGIKKLTELDYSPHALGTVIGESYRASTLGQFLGELERVALGSSLNTVLAAGARGKFCYIDGHMIAFWSRLKMHKGLITMLGRIMPGSKAVLAHDETGMAIGAEYYPPDTHLSHILEQYCRRISEKTGIRDFIIDREINSVKTARLFTRRQWGLICLLDANEYEGLVSFRKKYAGKLDEETILYKGHWKTKRDDDPRHFIIAQEPERCLVYWCTSDISRRLTARQIVMLYRQRTEIQENGIKRMVAHGALNTNYGTKKIWSTDRTHQRKLDKFDQKIEKLSVKQQKFADQLDDQMFKIQESIEKGHGKLYEKRLDKLKEMEAEEKKIDSRIDVVETQRQAIGSPGQRADRDFRKQTIMTCRTLFLENALRKFISLLSRCLDDPIDVEVFLDLFFLRRGMCIETERDITYLIDSGNLSRKYRGILERIVEGCNQIFLAHRGKTISFKMTGFT